MPRTWGQGAGFGFGVWLAFTLLVPLVTPRANASDPDLVRREAELHLAVNAFRLEQHLIPLERRPDLDAVARAHSADMVARRFFSHESPEGWNWVDRLQRAGIRDFAMAGENVGLTNRARPNVEILEGWKRSLSHRQNLTARPYNSTGIGIARAPDGTLFYTQLYLSFPR